MSLRHHLALLSLATCLLVLVGCSYESAQAPAAARRSNTDTSAPGAGGGAKKAPHGDFASTDPNLSYDVSDEASDADYAYAETETELLPSAVPPEAVEPAVSRPADGSDASSYPSARPSPDATAIDGLASISIPADGSHRPTSAKTASKPAEAPTVEAPVRESEAKRSEPARQRPQSGTLTAGSFDDNANYADYRDFLSKALQNDSSEVFPRLAYGDRVMIHVAGAEGRAVGDAKITIRLADAQDTLPLHTTTTGSDGRALLLTGLDGLRSDAQYQVHVETRDGKTKTQTLATSAAPWKIEIPEAQSTLPTQLDLALVIDATGSMGDEIAYLKSEIDDIVKTVHDMFPNVDQRFALIVYRDKGDQYVTRAFDFTSSLSEFRSQLSAQEANGGGDYPEAMHLALEQAAGLSWRQGNTARAMFLVADAPPHDHEAGAALDAIGKLRRQNVRTFPVAASGVKTRAEFMMRAAAFTTLGQYAFLTDHSGVGNAHAAPHVPKYNVERLNRLMIRLISQELAGKQLVPREIIAIENGDQSAPEVPGIVDPTLWRDVPTPAETQPDQKQVSTLPVDRPFCRVGAPSVSWSNTLRYSLFGVLVLGLFAFDTTVGRRKR